MQFAFKPPFVRPICRGKGQLNEIRQQGEPLKEDKRTKMTAVDSGLSEKKRAFKEKTDKLTALGTGILKSRKNKKSLGAGLRVHSIIVDIFCYVPFIDILVPQLRSSSCETSYLE
jgi:hypothetical protein